MQSNLFAAENLEKESAQPGMRLQNKSMLKIDLDGDCDARTGTMVAYQGQVTFTALGSGGAAKWLKKQLTGEGVPLMKLSGKGDVMLADRAKEIHLIDLGPGDAITVNGANILAFEPTVTYDIKMVQGMGMLSAAGMFNCVFTGPGRIAITTDGYPLTLQVGGQPSLGQRPGSSPAVPAPHPKLPCASANHHRLLTTTRTSCGGYKSRAARPEGLPATLPRSQLNLVRSGHAW